MPATGFLTNPVRQPFLTAAGFQPIRFEVA